MKYLVPSMIPNLMDNCLCKCNIFDPCPTDCHAKLCRLVM